MILCLILRIHGVSNFLLYTLNRQAEIFLYIKTITLLLSFLWLVKSLKNLLIIGFLINSWNVASFLISSMVSDLLDQLRTLTILLHRITGGFNKSRATQAMTLDISKAHVVWHACLLHRFKPYGIPGRVFGIILSILNNRLLQVVLDGNS